MGSASCGARRLVAFAAPLVACVIVYLTVNHARFGSPWDTGYGHVPHDGHELLRRERSGLFSLA